MTNTTDFTARVFAIVGAFAMTATLFVSSFATPGTLV